MKNLISKSIFFIFTVVLFNSSVIEYIYSQPVSRLWVQRYNGASDGYDYTGPLVVDASGNVYASGTSDSSGTGKDIVLIKYNSSGVKQWVTRYNSPFNSDDEITGELVLDNSGNIYIPGKSYGPTNLDILTLKYNSSGVLQWASRFDGPAHYSDQAKGISVDDSGNVYVGGQANYSSTLTDFIVIKYNSNGDTVWTRHWDGGENPSSAPQDYLYGMTIDQSNNIYLCGRGTTYPGRTIGVVLKYSSSGALLWQKIFERPQGSYDPTFLKIDNANGFLYGTGSTHGNSGNSDFMTFKMNLMTGDTSWIKTYNGPGNNTDQAYSLVYDNSGIYVTGRSQNSSNQYDFATVKYNSSGIEQWAQRYTGAANSNDEAYSISIDYASNIYVAGSSYEGPPTNYDATVIKYNSSGTQQWIIKFDTLNGSGYAVSVTVDAQYNVYIAASQPFNNVFHDIFTLKYAQVVGIVSISSEIPKKFSLSQNYPNPFNPMTKIKFDIPKAFNTKLAVYDILGKEVAVLVNDNLKPGSYEVELNSADLPSGTYFYRLVTDGFSETKKMTLIK